MKKPMNSKSYLSALILVCVSITSGYFISSHTKPTTSQDLSSMQEQAPAKQDDAEVKLPEINTRFAQNIIILKRIENSESRRRVGVQLLGQIMSDLKKTSDELNETSFRLVDMLQIVRDALTTKCSQVPAVSKFLEISDVQAVQMINGNGANSLSKLQIELNERKAYNMLLCNQDQ